LRPSTTDGGDRLTNKNPGIAAGVLYFVVAPAGRHAETDVVPKTVPDLGYARPEDNLKL
jgi:hypothetical protein